MFGSIDGFPCEESIGLCLRLNLPTGTLTAVGELGIPCVESLRY